MDDWKDSGPANLHTGQGGQPESPTVGAGTHHHPGVERLVRLAAVLDHAVLVLVPGEGSGHDGPEGGEGGVHQAPALLRTHPRRVPPHLQGHLEDRVDRDELYTDKNKFVSVK